MSSEPSGDVDPDLRSLFARLKIHDESVTLAEAISVRAMRDEREKHRSLFQSAPKLTNLLAEVRGAAQEEANVARLAERSFDEFWSIYPRHVAKGGARKAWTTALRKAAAEQLITGARRYAERVKAERTPERYVAHPATWLNQERWTDETSPARTPSSPATYQNPPADAYLGYLDY